MRNSRTDLDASEEAGPPTLGRLQRRPSARQQAQGEDHRAKRAEHDHHRHADGRLGGEVGFGDGDQAGDGEAG